MLKPSKWTTSSAITPLRTLVGTSSCSFVVHAYHFVGDVLICLNISRSFCCSWLLTCHLSHINAKMRGTESSPKMPQWLFYLKQAYTLIYTSQWALRELGALMSSSSPHDWAGNFTNYPKADVIIKDPNAWMNRTVIGAFFAMVLLNHQYSFAWVSAFCKGSVNCYQHWFGLNCFLMKCCFYFNSKKQHI